MEWIGFAFTLGLIIFGSFFVIAVVFLPIFNKYQKFWVDDLQTQDKLKKTIVKVLILSGFLSILFFILKVVIK